MWPWTRQLTQSLSLDKSLWNASTGGFPEASECNKKVNEDAVEKANRHTGFDKNQWINKYWIEAQQATQHRQSRPLFNPDTESPQTE